MSLAEALDSLAGLISPRWAVERVAARSALAVAQGYRRARLIGYPDATPSRLDLPVVVRGASGDYELETGWDRRRLLDRARMLEKTNLIASALLDRSVEAVVGQGFRFQAKSADPAWNRAAEALWEEWSEHEADARGMDTLGELVGTLYRSMLRDGDAALVLSGPDAPAQSLRLAESDEISHLEGYHRTDRVDGIDLDPQGRPVAFHVLEPQRTPQVDRRTGGTRVTYPASRVVFLARRIRKSQTRGSSAFTGLFRHLEQLEGTIEAVTVSYRMAASFGLVVKKKGPLLGLQATTDGAGNATRTMRLEPGAITRLEPDEDIGQVAAEQPEGSASEHIRGLVRLCGTRFAAPLELVLGDFSQTSFSSARAASLLSDPFYRAEQARIMRVYRALASWRLLWAMETGRLPYREDALTFRFLAPGRPWINPIEEVQAAQAAIDCGLETRAAVCARRGVSFEDDVLPALAREQAALAKAGVAQIRSTYTRDPVAPTAPAVTPSAPPPESPEAAEGEDAPPP